MRLKPSQLSAYRAKQLKAQGYRCALCKTPLVEGADACQDHDHTLGYMRGVLCRNCNGVEGKIRNLVTRARRGMLHIDFLRRIALYWEVYADGLSGTLPVHPTHKTPAEKKEIVKKRAKAKKLAKKPA